MSVALDLISNKTGAPVVPEIPVEPEKPVKTRPGVTFVPLEEDTQAANDPKPVIPEKGLFSGVAPDPSKEFAPEPEPDIPDLPEGEEGGNRFKRLDLGSSANDNKVRYLDSDGSTAMVTASIATEEEFIEFWAVDAYEMVSDLFALFRIDLSDIQTDPDEVEQGRKAAKHLWKASGRYKWLAWMRSEATIGGGDLFISLAFFAGKGAMAVRAVKKHKAKSAQKQKIKKKTPPVIEGESEVIDDA